MNIISIYLKNGGRFRVKQEVVMLRVKLRKRPDQGPAVMTQPSTIVVSPFCIEADVHSQFENVKIA